MKTIKLLIIMLILSISITCAGYIDIPKIEEELSATTTTVAPSTTTTYVSNLTLEQQKEMVLVPVAGKSLTMINAWNTNDAYVSTTTNTLQVPVVFAMIDVPTNRRPGLHLTLTIRNL